MTSITRRLVVSTVMGAGLLILGQVLVLYFVERGELVSQKGERIEEHLESLSSLLSVRSGEITFDFDPTLMHEFASPEGGAYFQIWRADGEELARSPSLGTAVLPRTNERGDASGAWSLRLPDGTSGRAMRREIQLAAGEPGGEPVRLELLAAEEVESVRSTLWRFLLTDFLVACGTVAILALYLTWVVRSLLRPVRAFGAHVESLDASGLTTPAPVVGLPEELAPIASSFERLQGRLAESFARERRTASSMAHELRTPVAELLTMSDVAMMHADEPEVAQQYLREVRDVALQMRDLISTMLSVARLQLVPEDLKPVPLALDVAFREMWRAFEEKAAQKELELDHRVEPDVRVLADEGVLKSILSNLVSNAVEYAPVGSVLSVSVARDAENGVVRLGNRCQDLRVEDLDRMTEFFWRRDGARSSTDEHVGLGLAVTHELARVSGMELRLAIDGETFVATLEVPLCASAEVAGERGADSAAR